jgi:hypothetical protein
MNRLVALFAFAACVLPPAVADPAVTIALHSLRDGTVIAPGMSVDWWIAIDVSAGDNHGAAMISVDLVQNSTNPVQFDLPPASGVPIGMANFSRPSGICNPGEGGTPTGYVGLQRGPAGARNLVQIGGAQNTFGQAFPPGAGVGESAIVTPSIGQGGSQTLASGSFPAPSVCGAYRFSLAEPIVNVITVHNNPPSITTVARATSTLAPGTISFIVAPTGDVDLDFDVDIADLTQLLAGFGTIGGATLAQGDLTGDGDVNLDDLTLMLGSFGASCP